MAPAHLEFLQCRNVLEIGAAAGFVLGDLLGEWLIDVNRVPGKAKAVLAVIEMLADVVGRNDAVAVEKEQIGRVGDVDAFIAATGDVKSFVRMGGETNGKIGAGGELAD